MHVIVYVELVIGLTTRVPDVAIEPDQAPEAAHELAFVDDQVSVDDWPMKIIFGRALIMAPAGGCVTIIVPT